MADGIPENAHDGNTQPLPVSEDPNAALTAPTEQISNAELGATPVAAAPFLVPAEPMAPGAVAAGTRSRSFVPWLVAGAIAVLLVIAGFAVVPNLLPTAAPTSTPTPTPTSVAVVPSPTPTTGDEEAGEEPTVEPPPAPEEPSPAPEEPAPVETTEPEPTTTPEPTAEPTPAP